MLENLRTDCLSSLCVNNQIKNHHALPCDQEPRALLAVIFHVVGVSFRLCNVYINL